MVNILVPTPRMNPSACVAIGAIVSVTMMCNTYIGTFSLGWMFTFIRYYGTIMTRFTVLGRYTAVEHYALAPDEVLLFQGNVIQSVEALETRLVLTNLHLTLIQEDGICITKQPVANIKIYKDVPQIIAKNRHVDIS